MSKPVNKNSADTGAVEEVVERSNANGSGTGNLASSLELAAALESSQAANSEKDAEIARLRAQLSDKDKASASDDAISKLAATLAALIPKPAVQAGPTESETINKTTDFNSQKVAIDGRSLMEAQMAVNAFRNESKVPVSVAKSLQGSFGPFLAVSVNGVRVSIPCDGRTYYINKTHAEHIKERIAKVDNLNAKPGEEITIKA